MQLFWNLRSQLAMKWPATMEWRLMHSKMNLSSIWNHLARWMSCSWNHLRKLKNILYEFYRGILSTQISMNWGTNFYNKIYIWSSNITITAIPLRCFLTRCSVNLQYIYKTSYTELIQKLLCNFIKIASLHGCSKFTTYLQRASFEEHLSASVSAVNIVFVTVILNI